MSMERGWLAGVPVRGLAAIVSLCGMAGSAWAQPADGGRPGPVVIPLPPARRPAPPPITQPQPRLIVEKGKPLIFTSVPQPLGTVPVSITRAPRSFTPSTWNNGGPVNGSFDRPVRRGGLLGGVPVKFPNVLSPSASRVPETFGPVYSRPRYNAPWPCPEPRPYLSHAGGARSMVGPSGAVYSTGASLTSESGFSANIDLGNVQIHIGSTPPIWSKPQWNGWHGGGGWGGGGGGWCGTGWDCGPSWGNGCLPTYPAWDYGWWSGYSTSSYVGPVYGSGWYDYDPALFYPATATQPAAPAAASQADADASGSEELVQLATSFMQDSRFAQASEVLKEYTRRQPGDAGAWRWLGIAQLADRKVKDAVYSFARAYVSNDGLADLALEYEAMGLDRSDLREMCSPLLTYARVSKSADAYMMAAVIMDARGLDDQAIKLLGEAKAAGLDPMLAQRLSEGFSK